jgi:hypothetical protein
MGVSSGFSGLRAGSLRIAMIVGGDNWVGRWIAVV